MLFAVNSCKHSQPGFERQRCLYPVTLSQTYINKLEYLKGQVMNELKKKAALLDCNAIICVSIDTE